MAVATADSAIRTGRVTRVFIYLFCSFLCCSTCCRCS
jgi:hypothetical protein